MEFEWDTHKAALNVRKHGVDFSVAARVFLDPARLEREDDRPGYGEQRWVTVGLVEDIELAVAYTERKGVFRLISAGKADTHERKAYWNR